MTQQLSALRVSADLDPSKYVAGAQQKVAADAAMTASSKTAAAGIDAVGNAVNASTPKISQAGDVLNRLSKQYVDGFAAAQKFESAMAQLSKGVDTGKISITQTGPILDGIYKRYGQTADAASFAAKGQAELGFAVAAANSRFVAAKPAVEAHGSALGIGNTQTMALTHSLRSFGEQMAMGIPVTQAAISEMNHLTYAMSGEDGLLAAAKKAGPAVLGFLATPTGLATAGIAAVLIGITTYALLSKDHIKSLDETMKIHQETVKALTDQYGALGTASGNFATVGGSALTDARAREDHTLLQAQARQQMTPFMSGLSDGGILPLWLGGGQGSVDQLHNLSQAQLPFAGAVKELFDNVKSGNPDLNQFDASLTAITQKLATTSDDPTGLQNISDGLSAIGHSVFDVNTKFTPFMAQIDRLKVEGAAGLSRFNTDVETLGQQKGLQKLADDAILLGKGIVEVVRAAAELESVMERLDQEATRPGLRDSRALGGYVNQRGQRLGRQDEQFQADQDLARATTNAERLAAVERQARAATPTNADDGGGKQARVDRALEAERNRQTIAADAAQVTRQDALDKTMATQRLEIGLIGQSTAATETQRMQFQLLSQLQAESSKTGAAMDKEEIANINAKAEAYGRQKAQMDAINAIRGQVDTISSLRLEAQLVGQNDNVRTKALATYQTEIQIQQLGIDQYGQLADKMRSNTVISADLTAELKKQNDAWTSVSNTAGSAIDTLVGSAATGFKDISTALTTMAQDITKTTLQLTVANPLKNWLTGSDLPTMGDVGKMGGAIGQLFGRSPGNPASAIASTLADRSTAMMTVTAGVVNFNGAGAGGIAGLLGAGGAPTGDMSSYASAIRSMESGGNYQALGPKLANGDQALGAYQVMASNLPSWSKQAFGQSVARSDFLGDPALQDSIFSQQFGKSLSKYGNPQDAASAWFTGRPMSTGSGASDILGTTGSQYVDKFNTQLGKLSSTTAGATQNLGIFGGGLGKLGNALNQFPAAPGGGSGALGSLLGGLSSSFSGTAAYSYLSANPGGYIGLYDFGGYTGPGSKHEPAGVVHKGEVVFSQDDVRRAGGVGIVEAMRHGLAGYADGGAVAMPSLSRGHFPANGNSGGSQMNVTVNGAPPGTTVRENRRRSASGQDMRDVVIDIVNGAEADGAFDDVRGARTGGKLVTVPR